MTPPRHTGRPGRRNPIHERRWTMNAQEAIRTALKGTQHLVNEYLKDLFDADLLTRPVPAANHIAWQLGHFIATETKLADLSPAFAYPALPKGFAQQHGPETAKQDP